MFSPQHTLLCRYRYDPLDRLISHAQSTAPRNRFYCKTRLVTEIQGALRHSIVQHGDLLLAQQQHERDAFGTTLLSTDLQRSVLHTLEKNTGRQPIAYSPYGHRSAESGLTSLLGFNGERPDPVTGHYLLGNGYRAFNPVLMRFNSPDSWSPFGKGGLNSYAYCFGDPINLADPNGHNPFTLLKNLFNTLFAPKTANTTATFYGTNKFNFADYLGNTGDPLSLNDLAMRKSEKMFGAMPGSQIKALLDSAQGSAVKIWDRKTGMHNIQQHVINRGHEVMPYDVISAGLRGELNGVLPHRANELSILISEGKFPIARSLKDIHTRGFKIFKMDIHRQNEIYRQTGIPLPDAFLQDYLPIRVNEKSKEIRFDVRN